MPKKYKSKKESTGVVLGFFVKGVTVENPSEEGKKISSVFTARSAAEQFAKEAMKTGTYTHTWIADKLGSEHT